MEAAAKHHHYQESPPSRRPLLLLNLFYFFPSSSSSSGTVETTWHLMGTVLPRKAHINASICFWLVHCCSFTRTAYVGGGQDANSVWEKVRVEWSREIRLSCVAAQWTRAVHFNGIPATDCRGRQCVLSQLSGQSLQIKRLFIIGCYYRRSISNPTFISVLGAPSA